MNNISTMSCHHCDVVNTVAVCVSCDRSYVITKAHLKHLPREFNAEAIKKIPEDFQIPLCDFCTTKLEGKLGEAVNASLRQRTCPACKTEFLSQHER